MLQTILSD